MNISSTIQSSQINTVNKINNKEVKTTSFKGYSNYAQNAGYVAPQPYAYQYNSFNFNTYNRAVSATNTLQNPNSNVLNSNLNKTFLYKSVNQYSETLSNPILQILVQDDVAVEDNKQLADAIPRNGKPSWRYDVRFSQLANMAIYEKQTVNKISSQTLDAMKGLINEYYILPDSNNGEQKVLNIANPNVSFEHLRNIVPNDYIDAANHIVGNWKNLVRQTPTSTNSSLIPLPNPYIIPGGRFREIYYWDSYFTMLGLNKSGLSNLSTGMVDNFKYLVKQFGFVPNGNRTYYLSRSQPPFLALMANEVAPKDLTIPQNRAWLEDTYKVVTHEYFNNWMDPNTHFVPSMGLNRYFDAMDVKRPESWGADNIKTPNNKEFYQHERSECESGWDFSNRFDQRASDHIPVDLNALLYRYEKIFEEWATQLGNTQDAKYWSQAAERRRQNINKYLWNPQKGMFYDFDMKKGNQSEYKSIATAYPLWTKLATAEQAKAIKENIIKEFEQPGGIVASLDTQNQDFQWNFPNGWPPHQLITVEGLNNYGFNSDAKRIASKWLQLNTTVFKQTNRFVEKYNVVENSVDTTGTYPLQDGFGWTNGVYLELLDFVTAK